MWLLDLVKAHPLVTQEGKKTNSGLIFAVPGSPQRSGTEPSPKESGTAEPAGAMSHQFCALKRPNTIFFPPQFFFFLF